MSHVHGDGPYVWSSTIQICHGHGSCNTCPWASDCNTTWPWPIVRHCDSNTTCMWAYPCTGPAHGTTGPAHGGLTLTLTMTTRCCFGLCFSYLMPANQRRHDEADDDYDKLFCFLFFFSDLMPTNQRRQKARHSKRKEARKPDIQNWKKSETGLSDFFKRSQTPCLTSF